MQGIVVDPSLFFLNKAPFPGNSFFFAISLLVLALLRCLLCTNMCFWDLRNSDQSTELISVVECSKNSEWLWILLNAIHCQLAWAANSWLCLITSRTFGFLENKHLRRSRFQCLRLMWVMFKTGPPCSMRLIGSVY